MFAGAMHIWPIIHGLLQFDIQFCSNVRQAHSHPRWAPGMQGAGRVRKLSETMDSSWPQNDPNLLGSIAHETFDGKRTGTPPRNGYIGRCTGQTQRPFRNFQVDVLPRRPCLLRPRPRRVRLSDTTPYTPRRPAPAARAPPPRRAGTTGVSTPAAITETGVMCRRAPRELAQSPGVRRDGGFATTTASLFRCR